uniref:Uncharacterized protein n=1 Tax=Rhizophora mucronata TaxID=61149 RepID=A0A2P2QHZ9_RHIMU
MTLRADLSEKKTSLIVTIKVN